MSMVLDDSVAGNARNALFLGAGSADLAYYSEFPGRGPARLPLGARA